jgi:adenylate kinase family enzyme
VVVVGNSGSGKSTLARVLAARLGCGAVELDGIYWQPNWTPLIRDAFRTRVTDLVAAEWWVVDGNHSTVADLVLARADTFVWLDLPRLLAMARITRRTLVRMVTKRPLWNGNTESFRNLLSWDPERNILRWAWTRRPIIRERNEALLADPANAHLRPVRLRSRADVRQFLSTLPPPPD